MQTKLFLSIAALSGLLAPPASAMEFDFAGINLRGTSFVTVGAGIRMQDRDSSLIHKLNLPGQQGLCDADDCLSLTGETEPNQRLVDAPGDFSAHLFDDGNLNYDRGDLFTGLAKLNSDWQATWGNWFAQMGVIGFYDVVNTDFTTQHPNTLYQAAETPRSDAIDELAAWDFELRSWKILGVSELFAHEFVVSVGRQRLRWGESNLTLFNTLDVINPLDARLARQPGFPIKDAYNPVELVTLSTYLTDELSVELFYQWKWRGVQAEPSGTMLSAYDSIGGGSSATLSLGQFPEDPEARYVSNGILGLFSNSHRTIYLPEEDAFAPRDDGQFGLNLRTYLPDFLGGTELGIYGAIYHSRLPYFSMTAAQESCARNSQNIAQALDDCNGFNSARNQATAERCDPRGCNLNAYLAREILPVDTATARLEYPEDIQIFGFSFNSTVFGWSLSGEYSYRPNMPFQVLISDIFFAGIQPALPANEFGLAELDTLDPAAILNLLTSPASYPRYFELMSNLANEGYLGPQLGQLNIPGARQTAPDRINHDYRGVIAEAGDYIQGYERFKMHQITVTALKVFAENPIGSDSIVMAIEAGATIIQDLPDFDEGLYLQGLQNFTHPSPGADGTGRPNGEAGEFSFNPTQQTEGFGDDFSWGLRLLLQLDYPNVWNTGINIKPSLIGFYDVAGITPFPAQNYVEGNIWLLPSFVFEFGANFSSLVMYQYFAGDNNQYRDRDNLTLSFTYSF